MIARLGNRFIEHKKRYMRIKIAMFILCARLVLDDNLDLMRYNPRA